MSRWLLPTFVQKFIIKRIQLNKLAFLSLIIFSGIGWLIHEYQLEQPMTEVFSRGGTLVYQIFWGVVYGLVMSLIAWKLVNMKFLQSTR